eukprot:COSAG05_NODE_749_length_7548_cov_9.496442_4_plen_44_part_00
MVDAPSEADRIEQGYGVSEEDFVTSNYQISTNPTFEWFTLPFC